MRKSSVQVQGTRVHIKDDWVLVGRKTVRHIAGTLVICTLYYSYLTLLCYDLVLSYQRQKPFVAFCRLLSPDAAIHRVLHSK